MKQVEKLDLILKASNETTYPTSSLNKSNHTAAGFYRDMI